MQQLQLTKSPLHDATSVQQYRQFLLNSKGLDQATKLKAFRLLARTDLFFLLWYLLGKKFVEHPWLFARCKEIEREPNGYLDLWARGHCKTTIITFGKTIQDILASHGENPLAEWKQIAGGSEPSFAIFSGTNKVAVDLLKMIKSELESNRTLIDMFPDILYEKPDSEATQWNLSGITVKRKATGMISATLEAHGIDSLPTGKRFNVMIFDDCVNDTNVTTPEQIAASKWQWGQAQNLSMKGMMTIKRHIGTFYHWNDLYCELIEKQAVIARKHAATEDGTINGKLVYLTEREWRDNLRTLDMYNIGCQHLLNPSRESISNFKFEWLRYGVHSSLADTNRYIVVDPADSQEKNSDYTVMIVIAAGRDEHYYVVDMIRDRIGLLERTEKLFKLVSKYKPNLVGYEKYGMQSDIAHIRQEMARNNFQFNIVELKGRLKKEERIKRLEPDFRNGKILFPPLLTYINYEGKSIDLIQTFIREEYLQFPTSKHDDMLDALSRIKDDAMMIRFPMSADWEEVNYKGWQPRNVNEVTGY